MDENNTMVLSYLHPAIKPLNQLRALEDSSLIYHLSRAPERRIFYIDVGNLPKIKAEQYVRDMMVKYKNKLSYNAQTGEIKDERKFMTMLEDYWLPRREGGRGTEIDVLEGGTALPQLLESVQYFQDRLYRSLQVPLTRMKPDAVYNLGRATEITRDEVNFSKFIDRVRSKFVFLFLSALEKQLVLKRIAAPEDWDQMKKYIKFRFNKDNYFAELKDLELMNDRFVRLQEIDQYAGKYYSHMWVRKNVLKQTDEEIEENDEQIAQEIESVQYNPEILQQELMQQQAQPETKDVKNK
jgi:polyhydroxyalkanoate synthesis regulator phasin